MNRYESAKEQYLALGIDPEKGNAFLHVTSCTYAGAHVWSYYNIIESDQNLESTKLSINRRMIE